jgi:FkbM family methyltransferase
MGLKQIARRYLARRLHVPDIPTCLNALAARGFHPRLVFDVGAYRGDFAQTCLALWSNPKPEIACFEPLAGALTQLERLRAQLPIHVIPGLVGAQDLDEVPLHEMETASSVLEEHINHKAPISCHRMRMLDTVIRESFHGRCPDLLKVDTQGYELEVLKGTEDSLRAIRFVLAELNLLDIHCDVPLMHDLVAWIAKRGFVPYDICGLTHRPLDGALWQTDILFAKRDDPLRQDKRWER